MLFRSMKEQYLAFLTPTDCDTHLYTIAPARWVTGRAFRDFNVNAILPSLEAARKWRKDMVTTAEAHLFSPGCVSLEDIEDIFATANRIYTLIDEGYLESTAAEAFQPTKEDA